MNRTFNLLPARYAERVAEQRRARVTAGALVALLGIVVLVGLNQSSRLEQAERQRDVERERNAALVARRGELARFRQLADGILARERLLAAAMGTEVSWAKVLSSFAVSFPGDASLTSFSAESKLPPFGGVPPSKPANQRPVIGSTTLNGYSVNRFTPGVERLLQLLATVTGLSEPRLQVGTLDEIGAEPVTTFEGSAFLDGRALSGRYANGLPAEDDVEVPVTGGGAAGAPAPAGTGMAR